MGYRKISVLLVAFFGFVGFAVAAPSANDLNYARDQIKIWHDENMKYEAEILDAFSGGDQAALFELHDRLTKRAEESRAMPIWREDYVNPYIPCNTAMIDMSMLSLAMGSYIANKDTTHKAILGKEQADYDSSKALCESRLELPVAKAWEQSLKD